MKSNLSEASFAFVIIFTVKQKHSKHRMEQHCSLHLPAHKNIEKLRVHQDLNKLIQSTHSLCNCQEFCGSFVDLCYSIKASRKGNNIVLSYKTITGTVFVLEEMYVLLLLVQIS